MSARSDGLPRPVRNPASVAPRLETLMELEGRIPSCVACPRLVRWREEVGRVKRRAFRDWIYWARPVPGWGDPRARLVVVGLAPAAHGGNRTGRVFTGDRSGDFLYAALHRAGLANQARSESRDDGLVLRGVWVTLSARCAPPDNAPRPDELARCAPWLTRELDLLRPRVVLVLGAVAWTSVLGVLRARGVVVPRPARSSPTGRR
jgi:uracil-DNA glycosylase family 4